MCLIKKQFLPLYPIFIFMPMQKGILKKSISKAQVVSRHLYENVRESAGDWAEHFELVTSRWWHKLKYWNIWQKDGNCDKMTAFVFPETSDLLSDTRILPALFFLLQLLSSFNSFKTGEKGVFYCLPSNINFHVLWSNIYTAILLNQKAFTFKTPD